MRPVQCELCINHLLQFTNRVSRSDPSGQRQREFDADSGTEIDNSVQKAKQIKRKSTVCLRIIRKCSKTFVSSLSFQNYYMSEFLILIHLAFFLFFNRFGGKGHLR